MPTQHSVSQCPVPSVSGPFSAAEHRGGRGWKQGNWDQSVSRRHYQFCPDNTSTFHFHPRNAGGRRRGPSQRQWQEKEMMDMKMSLPPPTLPSLSGWKNMWCHILSELGSWPRGYSCWSASSHVSASGSIVKADEQSGERCVLGQLEFIKIHCVANVWVVTYVGNKKSGNSTRSVWYILDFFFFTFWNSLSLQLYLHYM